MMERNSSIKAEGQEDKNTEEVECCIKELIPGKISLFTQYACMASFLPYLNIFLVEIGLSVSQAGMINGIRNAFAFFLVPAIGFIADYTKRQKLVMQVLMISFPVQILTPFYASFFVKRDNHVSTWTNSTNSTKTPNLPTNLNINETFNEKLFFAMLGWLTFMATFGNASFAFVDGAIIQLVKKHNKQTSYGLQKLFAPIGFTVGALISGAAVDVYSNNNPFLTKYTAIFFSFTPFAVILFTTTLFLKIPNHEKETLKPVKLIIELCQNKRTVIFLLTVAISGISYMLINGFLLLLLEELKTPKTVIGITLAISSVSEIFIFPVCSKIQQVLGGAFPCFILSLVFYFIRFMVFSFAGNYWLILPVQSLHAISYALFWTAALEYNHETTPRSILVTMTNVMVALFFSFGNFFSNIAGGIIYQYLGGQILFQIVGSICLTWSIFLLLYYIKYERLLLVKEKKDEVDLKLMEA